MSVSVEEVRHIATVARLEFSPQALAVLAEEMSVVLDYMKTLNELDTEGVEPMTHVSPLDGVVRDDKVKQRISVDDALRNAPDVQGDYFRVPKVMD